MLVGAGDIATCGLTGDTRTAALLDGIAGRVFVAGDIAYPDGTDRPVPRLLRPDVGPLEGPHVAGARQPRVPLRGRRALLRLLRRHGPARPAPGWYAYDLGTWRVYCLNTNCDRVGCGAASAQGNWLAADLAANPRACVAAVLHHPLVSSGVHGNNPAVAALWRALEEAGAEVALTGHDHDYERFAPQTGDRVRTRTASASSSSGPAARPCGRSARRSAQRRALLEHVRRAQADAPRRVVRLARSCRSPAARSPTRAAATCH